MPDINRDVGDLVEQYTSDYSQYVATNRAIPSAIDGLKPVHRRLILSADDLKIYHNKKHLKVAKLTGAVLGSYHPHGGADPVGLSQWFTTKYPCFDGHGNFGSPDQPWSYAAERYIEIRLSEFAERFYLESRDYADKDLNYDGSLEEVTQFYPPIPGGLLTSAEGIAVGLSTKIPSHNVTDVCNSLLDYINGKDSYIDLIPDTCEQSIILTPRDEIKKMYETGVGSVNYKAKTHYETIDNKIALVVDAFPPGYSKKRLETQTILDAVESGDLELINESKESIRYVFLSNRRDVLDEIENRLTNQVGYRFYMDHKGVIKCYTLKDLYDTFISDKKDYIVRKYTDLTKKSKDEYAYYDILQRFKADRDYIKSMLDKDSEEVINDIVTKYSTTEAVAKRIIGSSIRSLLKDNQKEILDKMKDLDDSIKEFSSYVDNPIIKIVKDINDFKSYMKLYGDARKSIHIDSIKDLKVVKYRGGKLKIQSSQMYYLGNESNEIKMVKGSEIDNIDDSQTISECGYKYYVLSDGYGIVGVTEDLMNTSKLKSDTLYEIVGCNDLETIGYIDDKGKTKKLGDWCLRKRVSYIKMFDKKAKLIV